MHADSSIETILKIEGPCLSSRLVSRLEQLGLSNAAARQRLARANGAVMRLAGLTFPRGVRFLYHESSFGSEEYWQALVRDISDSSPAYAAAVAALEARGGIVPRARWDIVSSSPIRQKGQIASETVLERLTKVNLLETVDVPGIGSCVRLAINGYFPVLGDAELRARLATEKLLLLAVRDWARKLGVASYDKIAMRDGQDGLPRVGTCAWDITGPSYLRPMLRRARDGKLQPGFLACDAVIGESMDEKAVAAFVRKCEVMSGLKRLPAVFPMLVADRFSAEGLRLGRSKGVMMATPATLFGREVAEGLAALLQMLTKAAAMAAKRPELIGELFDKLGRIEGAAGNLRGALFELAVGHCVVNREDGSIDIGRIFRDPQTGKSAEADVFRVKEYREVWAYECKAHQPTHIIGRQAVEEWLTEKVPLVHRLLGQEERFRESVAHFEFWTCGAFSPEAEGLLAASASSIRKYRIGWKDGAAVRAYVAKVRPKGIAKMLDEHFFAHPLALPRRPNEPGSPMISDVGLSLLIGGGGPVPNGLDDVLSRQAKG